MAEHREWLHADAAGATELILEGDELIVHTVVDEKPILDQNARERSLDQRGTRGGLGAYKAASIPTPIYFAWRKEWNQQHKDKWTWQTFIAMRLNSRDWAYLRTNDRKL